jgi:hypothetical protein
MIPPEELSDDLIRLLQIIKEKGGTDCSGTCHHRKPGEFHCHVLGPILKVSSQGVKNRILKLLRMGLLDRSKVEHVQAYPLTRFIISREGAHVLSLYEKRAADRSSPPVEAKDGL